jgi:rhodanese-related sulfurtransferase
MNNLYKHLSAITNIAITVVAIILAIVLIKSHFLADPKGETPGDGVNRLKIRDKLPVQYGDWNKSATTVLLVLSPGCDYCEKSIPFYKRLSQALQNQKDKLLVALLPESVNRADEYIAALGIRVDEVKQAPLNAIGINSTPNLIMVDNEGMVSHIWAGKLQPEHETQVLRQLGVNENDIIATNDLNPLNSNGDGSATDVTIHRSEDKPSYLEAQEVKTKIDSGEKVFLLDVRGREQHYELHIPQDNNIPIDEIEIRHTREVPRDWLVVIYCDCVDDWTSQIAYDYLKRKGLTKISVLHGGLSAWRKAGFELVKQ